MAQPTDFPPAVAAYIAELEHDHLHENKVSICQNCTELGFVKLLRRCTGCRLIDYCSKECQKAHWKRHRGLCNMVQCKSPKNGFLSGFEQDQVYQVVIDSYRVRTKLDHDRGENHGIYYQNDLPENCVWARGDVIEDFQQYFDLAEDAEVLPRWWQFEQRMACLSQAVDSENASNIFESVDREMLVLKYESQTSIWAALSILAELVVGSDSTGPVEDDSQLHEFQQHIGSHPEEKTELLRQSMESTKRLLKLWDRELPEEIFNRSVSEPDNPI